MIRPFLLSGLTGFALIACQGTESGAPAQPFSDTARVNVSAPPGAAPGTCWARETTPALLETVTDQILIEPAVHAPDGSVTRPPRYKTETHQKILRERDEIVFETPCPPALTPEFIASLQRALAARGLYRGLVTGGMDAGTRAAIRAFQAPLGLDTGVVSMKAARMLGLSAYPRSDATDG